MSVSGVNLDKRENQKQSKIVSDASKFFKILTSTTKELQDWHVLSDDLIQLDRKYTHEFEPENLQTIVFWQLLQLHMQD